MRAPPSVRDDKFNERRAELGEAALQTLAELGYARTSLREIAQNSAFSHGVLHYYFNDKIDLILCSVRQYKARFVRRYDQVTAAANTASAVLDGFCDKLLETMTEEAHMHRLWYDLRTQSMFEPAFREAIDQIDSSLEHMIWRVLQRYAELADRTLNVPSDTAYALLDGLFQQALLRHLSGDGRAGEQLQAAVRQLLPTLLADPARKPARTRADRKPLH